MELSYCTIPLMILLGGMIAAPFFIYLANRTPQPKPPAPPEHPEEPKHKVNLAKPIRRFAHVGGGLTVAASILLLVSITYQNVTLVSCGEEDTISRAVKGTKAETLVAAIPCPCGCGCK